MLPRQNRQGAHYNPVVYRIRVPLHLEKEERQFRLPFCPLLRELRLRILAFAKYSE